MSEKFCKHQIVTRENPKGYDCAAHLVEGRCFECSYYLHNIKYDFNQQKLFISHTENNSQGTCIDFEILKEFKENLLKKLKSK